MKEQTSRVSRRALARGVAWAAPVVTFAAAAPARAASGAGPTITVSSACKSPGESCHANPPQGYGLYATICNHDQDTIYIYSITYSHVTDLNGNPLPYTFTSNQTFTIPSGQCIDVLIYATSGNSANINFKMDMTATWGHTQTAGNDTFPHVPIVQNIQVPYTSPDCCK